MLLLCCFVAAAVDDGVDGVVDVADGIGAASVFGVVAVGAADDVAVGGSGVALSADKDIHCC